MLCIKLFLPYSNLNNNELKQKVIGKQSNFTHEAKPATSNAENFIKAVNSENNITKYFTIKDLNSTFNDTGNLFFLSHLNINLLSFHFDELQSLISKSFKKRELESVFTDIIQKDSKNIVVTCIYRHLCM